MSWDKYISDQLVGTGHVTKAAICGLDGAIWAQSQDFPITQAEGLKLAQAFNDPGVLAMSGLNVGNTKYFYLSGTEDVLRGKKGSDGVHVAKTNTAIIVGTYTEPAIQPNQCASTVEALADYLKQCNY